VSLCFSCAASITVSDLKEDKFNKSADVLTDGTLTAKYPSVKSQPELCGYKCFKLAAIKKLTTQMPDSIRTTDRKADGLKTQLFLIIRMQ
jgi:hypothetical protein